VRLSSKLTAPKQSTAQAPEQKLSVLPASLRPDPYACFTTQELAARWNVSAEQIGNLVDEGKLQGFDISAGRSKRQMRFPVEAVEAYWRENLS
jgi:excisionase family DNA binding protein